MTIGKLIKHDNNTDVALLVHRIVYIPEKRGYKIKGSWINIVGEHYPCGITEEVFVNNNDIKNWKVYEGK